MGKRNDLKDRDLDAKILFKKSSTNITYSRTCSGASQFTRSGILQIKKNLSQHQTSKNGGKLKKDFSIETDICVLRRYFKEKRNKMPNQVSSAKSKYSNYSEIDPIEEFDHDDSACGDSSLSEKPPQYYNTDLTTLMLDNFKNLLNSWVQKHLLEDNYTKKKFETAVNSILRKIESKRQDNLSSFSTFMRHRDNQKLEIKTKQIDTSSENRQFFEKSLNTSTIEYKDRSIYSLPISIQKLRVISTLSLPRNFPKRKSIYKKKIDKLRIDKNEKKLLISIYEASQDFTDCSSFNLLHISTKSLMRRCTNYKTMNSGSIRPKGNKRLTIVPEPSFKSKFNSTSSLEQQFQNVKLKEISEQRFKNNLICFASENQVESKKAYDIITEPSFKSVVISTTSLENLTKTENTKELVLNTQSSVPTKFNASDSRTYEISYISNPSLEKRNITEKSNESISRKSEINADAFKVISPSEGIAMDGMNSCDEDLGLTRTNVIDDPSISSVKIHNELHDYTCCVGTSQIFNNIRSKSFVKIDFVHQNVQSSIENLTKICRDLKDKKIETDRRRGNKFNKRIKKPRKHPIYKGNKPQLPKFETIQCKDFTYLYKKVNSQQYDKNDFLNHFKDIFNYFANHEGDKNINLDVHVNVFPMLENTLENISDVKLVDTKNNLKAREMKTSPTVVYNVDPSSNIYNQSLDIGESSFKESTIYSFSYQPEIIPLLDGAVSQAKYMVNKENSALMDKDAINKIYALTDRSTMTFDFEIVQEICELKTAIKNLASTAQRLAIEHLSNKQKYKDKSQLSIHGRTRSKVSMKLKSTQYSKSSKISKKSKRFTTFNASRGIQISSRFRKNLDSGFKIELRKGIKKNLSSASELKTFREDPSYRIIESETILKVTDMTSVGNNRTTEKTTDKALTCSMPPSKSLFEMSTENTKSEKHNFFTYYCDGINRKPGDFIFLSPCPSKECQSKHQASSFKKNKRSKKKKGDQNSLILNEESNSEFNIGDSEHFTVKCYDCKREFSCASVRLNLGSEGLPITVKKKRVMTTAEGYVYCFALWIPVIILFIFFYSNINKHVDDRKSTPRLIRSTPFELSTLTEAPTETTPEVYVKLSDLGF